jgi:hypothetical protein
VSALFSFASHQDAGAERPVRAQRQAGRQLRRLRLPLKELGQPRRFGCGRAKHVQCRGSPSSTPGSVTSVPAEHVEGLYSCLDYYQSV